MQTCVKLVDRETLMREAEQKKAAEAQRIAVRFFTFRNFIIFVCYYLFKLPTCLIDPFSLTIIPDIKL